MNTDSSSTGSNTAPPPTPTLSTLSSPTSSSASPPPYNQRRWKNSWCCHCRAWYTNCDLQNQKCIIKSCSHIWCPSCRVTDSDDRNAVRTSVKAADGIPKSLCCQCGKEHAGYTLSNGSCGDDANCGHIWCGECKVYKMSGEEAVTADEADFEISTCCKCKRDHGESPVLDEETLECAEPGCEHMICDHCWVRVRKEDGTWGTMYVEQAESSGLIPL